MPKSDPNFPNPKHPTIVFGRWTDEADLDRGDVPPSDSSELRHRVPSPERVNAESSTVFGQGDFYRENLYQTGLANETEYRYLYLVKGTSQRTTHDREIVLEKVTQHGLDKAGPSEREEWIKNKAELTLEQAFFDAYQFGRTVWQELSIFQTNFHEQIVNESVSVNSVEMLTGMLTQIHSLQQVINRFHLYTEGTIQLIIDYAHTYRQDGPEGSDAFLDRMNEELFLAIGMDKSNLPEHHQNRTFVFRHFVHELGVNISFDLLEEIVENRLEEAKHPGTGKTDLSLQEARVGEQLDGELEKFRPDASQSSGEPKIVPFEQTNRKPDVLQAAA